MPTTTVALILLVAFIVPGFMFRSIINRNILSREESDIRLILESLETTLLFHAAFAPWTIRLFEAWKANNLLILTTHIFGRQFPTVAVWALVVLFAVPFVTALVWSGVLEWKRVQGALGIVGASWDDRLQLTWDLFASRRAPYWVILEFKDGKRIGGRYGENSRMSLTTTHSHAPRDIFLEELYEVPDGKYEIGDKIPYNRGAWINGEELRSIRLFLNEPPAGAVDTTAPS